MSGANGVSRKAARTTAGDEPRSDPVAVERPSADLLDTPGAGGAAIRGGALRTAGYVGGLLVTLASIPFLVRHLGVADFGRYATVLSLLTLVAGITEFGINAMGMREYASLQGPERDRMMSTLLGMRLALTVVGLAIAVGFATLAGYQQVQVVGTLVAGVGMVLLSVQAFLTVGLTARLRFGWVAILDLARQVLSAALVIALVVAGASLAAFFVVAVPVSLALLVATVVLVSGALPLRPRFDLGEWRALARDTLVFAAAGGAYIAYFRVTIVVMSLVASATQTGYFATSFRIMEALTPIPLVLIGAAFPIFVRAARDDRARLRSAAQRVFDVALIAGTWASLAVVIGAGFAIDVIGGSKFEPSIAVLRIQGVALVATFIAFATSYPLIALRRHRELLLANLVPLAASLPLSLVLVSLFQARGGAVATLVAELMLAGGMVFFAVRSELALRIPWGKVACVALAAALACGAAVLVPGGDLVRAAAATVVYFAVLAALRQLPLEAVAAIRDSVREEDTPGDGSEEAAEA